MSTVTYSGFCVHAQGSAFQVKLDTRTPIAELIPQLLDELAPLSESDEVREFLEAEWASWAIERGPVRHRIDPESTLADSGVRPGTDLYLTHRKATEDYPVLHDDVAQGAEVVSADLYPKMSPEDTRRIGAAALPLAVAALSAVGAGSVILGDGGAIRWVVLGMLAVVSAMCLSTATVLLRAYEAYDDVAAGLSLSAYIAGAGAAVVSIPRDLSIWHLTTVGAVTVAMAAVQIALTGNRPATLHAGVAAVATCSVIVGVAGMLYEVSAQAAAAQMTALLLAIAVYSPQLARIAGRLRVNYLPATGEPLTDRRDMSIKEVSRRSTSAVAIEAVINRRDRVVETLSLLVGMVSGVSLAIIVAAFAGGWFTRQYEWQMFFLVAASCVALIAAGRGFAPRAAAVPLLIAGPTAWAAYLLGRAIGQHPADNTVLLAGAVPALTALLISAAWAIRQKDMYSPLSKAHLERIATVAVITVVPLLVLVMQVWARIRNS